MLVPGGDSQLEEAQDSCSGREEGPGRARPTEQSRRDSRWTGPATHGLLAHGCGMSGAVETGK